MGYQRYVALGDSTVEGVGDPYPDGRGYRGWADRLAERLALVEPTFTYANVAIRGRKVAAIRAEQLVAALAMKPDLATVVGGMNDLLRPSFNLDAVLADLDAMIGALRAQGATVMAMTYVDPSPIMPAARTVVPRIVAFNAGMRSLAERHGMLLADFERFGVLDARLWAPDRLHLNPTGHQRVADAFAHVLGLPGTDDAWTLPFPDPLPPPARRVTLLREVAWASRHMTPWVVRRLRGRSSGDGVEPKRPELAPLAPDR